MKRLSILIVVIASFLINFTFLSCQNDVSSSDDYPIVMEFEAGTTVWEGSSMFLVDDEGNWFSRPDGFITIYFSGVKEGDQIQITHTENSMSDYDYTALEFQGRDWTGGTLTLGGNCVNCTKRTWLEGYAYLKPYSANQTAAFNLTASDAKIINEANGLTIYGDGYTVKKVVIVSDTMEVLD